MSKQFDKLFMNFAQQMAEMSTCGKRKVGAIVTKDRRMMGAGYNGTPAGFIHCQDLNIDKKLHRPFGEQFEIHAEMNVILDMAKRGLSAKDCTIYITLSPCIPCAKLLITSGITRIVYLERWHRDPEDKKEPLTNDDVFSELSSLDIIRLMAPYISIEQFS
jgi:dCMP deaminase